jgi:hypothetical protein
MSAPRALRTVALVAASLAGLLPAAFVRAQTPISSPPAALLPGLAQSGRPAGNEAAAMLAPLRPPALPTARDQLPLDKLKLPPGFHI